ncbi:MAG: 3',5'-cyclic-nucleotide phosphodiesterase [Candidatus Latescibacterota bacterium]|nr:MAG: 3',5'-cyclic-nucleotide phosphodiesterase [Candidatus Latescibacterota bacterium]
MIFRVLGCSGSQSPSGHPCSFLIDDEIVLDMGSAATVLPHEQQRGIRHVLLSHPHLDHVKDLPFLVDNVFRRIDAPISVYGTASTLAKIRDHLFNDAIWPDFTALPTLEQATLKYHQIGTHEAYSVGKLSVRAIPVHHPGGCVAFLLESEKGILVYSGDTGPTEKLWRAVNADADRITALLVETSFPNRLDSLAEVSGHLTPERLQRELAKLEVGDVPIFIYHVKEATRAETESELKALPDPRLRLLEPGMTLEF